MADPQKVDRSIDPTANVLALVEAAVTRINDLHAAEIRRVDEIIKLRADYDAKLAEAETKRLDAVRSVDVAAVATATVAASAQAQVLATQLATSAETLRALVATTSAAVAEQLAQIVKQLTDRLAAIEKSQYETKASGGGMRDMWGWIAAGIMALATLYSIFGPHIK